MKPFVAGLHQVVVQEREVDRHRQRHDHPEEEQRDGRRISAGSDGATCRLRLVREVSVTAAETRSRRSRRGLLDVAGLASSRARRRSVPPSGPASTATSGKRRAQLLADGDADGLELRDGGVLHADIRHGLASGAFGFAESIAFISASRTERPSDTRRSA